MKPSKTNEQWNKVLESTRDRIEYLFSTNDIKEQAKALILGATAPIYLKMYMIERAKRLELEKKFGGIKKARELGHQTVPQNVEGKQVESDKEFLSKIFEKYAKST